MNETTGRISGAASRAKAAASSKLQDAKEGLGNAREAAKGVADPNYKLKTFKSLGEFDAHVEQCRAVVARADELASQLMFFDPRDDKDRLCIGFESYLNSLIAEVRRKRELAMKRALAAPPQGLTPAA